MIQILPQDPRDKVKLATIFFTMGVHRLMFRDSLLIMHFKVIIAVTAMGLIVVVRVVRMVFGIFWHKCWYKSYERLRSTPSRPRMAIQNFTAFPRTWENTRTPRTHPLSTTKLQTLQHVATLTNQQHGHHNNQSTKKYFFPHMDKPGSRRSQKRFQITCLCWNRNRPRF